MGLKNAFFKALDGPHRRSFKRSEGIIEAVSRRDGELTDLSSAELTAKAEALRGTPGADGLLYSKDDLVEFFVLAREVGKREVDMTPFDVQLLAAARMLDGDVVEMLTGEGKTLAGAIAATAFALRGRRVHLFSVNDYLAHRDSIWMEPFYTAFGVSVSWIAAGDSRDQRREAYAAEVTYAAVSEFGFDILRDRVGTDPIVPDPEVALVDEADSVLVDEARVPLVLAGATSGSAPSDDITRAVRKLRPGLHFSTDDDDRNVSLTEEGSQAIEAELGGIDLYSDKHGTTTLPQVNVALHARALLRRDVHYVIRDDKVHLINESRGRIAELQRWPDGLQAAVEAKESLPISATGEVLDNITVQALLKRYPLVCGMTGTALAADEQLRQFYQLSVSAIPPNLPCIRVDEHSRIYETVEQKEAAMVDYIKKVHATGRPILVGTSDVAESELLVKKLEKIGVSCVVLNAKNDEAEAKVIAEAGALKAVTVSTQMAGRGTDIRLGGSEQNDYEKVKALGGLCVVGSNRHSSSRLDDQLRGRAGRQGDPGSSIFFSSLEDDLVVRHAKGERLPTATDEDGRVRGGSAERLLDHAQRVANAGLLEIHSNTFRYSKLAEQHRATVDARREDLRTTDTALRELKKSQPKRYKELHESIEEETLVEVARKIAIFHLDRSWVEHLAFLGDLRESIHLHALARQDPLDEYHKAAIPAFRETLERAWTKTEKTFKKADITADGIDLDDAGLKRPTATWTYMVQDNPFGSELDRAVRGISRALGGRR